MKFYCLLIVFLVISGCQSKDGKLESTQEVAQNALANCPSPDKCESFESASYQCAAEKNPHVCAAFVASFKSLLAKGTCKRSFDTGPVFDIWYCASLEGAMKMDLHYKTLSELNSPEAKSLYGSQELRDSLDGSLSEEHKEKSLSVQKSLK